MSSDKPLIFISHSSKDVELARLLKQQIEICVDNAEAFASDIEPGDNWFETVMGKLRQSDAIVVLITPNSVNMSHWVWFEMGYFMARRDTEVNHLDQVKRVYYPLLVKGVDLPNPVYDLQVQAAFLDDKNGVFRFFRRLVAAFGGNTAQLDSDAITAHAGEIAQLVTTSNDRFTIMRSPYEDHPDDALLEIIKDDYVKPQLQAIRTKVRGVAESNEGDATGITDFFRPIEPFDELPTKAEFVDLLARAFDEVRHEEWMPRLRALLALHDNLFNGKMVHYSVIDERLRLPFGTAARLLKPLLRKEYQLVPETGQDFEVCTRFRLATRKEIAEYERKLKPNDQ